MTAYVSYRIKKIKTTRKLIEEIDTAPEDPPKCPPAKIKVTVRNIEKKVFLNPSSSPLSSSSSTPTENKSFISTLPQARIGTSPIIKAVGGSSMSQGNPNESQEPLMVNTIFEIYFHK